MIKYLISWFFVSRILLACPEEKIGCSVFHFKEEKEYQYKIFSSIDSALTFEKDLQKMYHKENIKIDTILIK